MVLVGVWSCVDRHSAVGTCNKIMRLVVSILGRNYTMDPFPGNLLSSGDVDVGGGELT